MLAAMRKFPLCNAAWVAALLVSVAQAAGDPVPMASYRNTELGLLYQYPASFAASDALAKQLESSLRAGASTPESTNGVKTPQQIYQQLQELQRQKQAQQQPSNPQ